MGLEQIIQGNRFYPDARGFFGSSLSMMIVVSKAFNGRQFRRMLGDKEF